MIMYIQSSTDGQGQQINILEDKLLMILNCVKFSAPERFSYNLERVIFKCIPCTRTDISSIPREITSGEWPRWWFIDIGSGNGLVPGAFRQQPLPEPVLTKLGIIEPQCWFNIYSGTNLVMAAPVDALASNCAKPSTATALTTERHVYLKIPIAINGWYWVALIDQITSFKMADKISFNLITLVKT